MITFSLVSGGAERFVVDLCNALAGNGDEVHLLATNEGRKEDHEFYLPDLSSKVKYVNLGARSGHRPRALIGIAHYIRIIKPDVVHAHSDLVQILLPALLFRKPKYFHTLHNVADFFLTCRCWKPVFKAFYSGRVHPVTISRTCSDSFRKLYGLSSDTMIENGRCRPSCSEQLGAVSSQLKRFKDGEPLFIHVARYAYQKNQGVLFQAFSMLENAKLLVVGSGYPDDIIAKQNKKNVLFTGVRHNIGDYLACADFFVLSSVFEGLPLSLLESMAYGVVPVSTPAGGVVDVIRDGETGYLSDDFTPESLASAMQRAIKGSISKEQIRAVYASKYSMEICAQKYLALFKESLRSNYKES